MKQHNVMCKIVLSCILLTACSANKEVPEIAAIDALQLDEKTIDKLRDITQIAREDSEEIGYKVIMVSLPQPATIYKEGKPLGAYSVKVASKSKSDQQKDIALIYYYSVNKEMMVRIPMGEADEEYEKNKYYPKDVQF
ncbi:hypothetical protein [Brevibacillus sp. NRS-1366]|uniref:hypothetical protein n=1 Tax=Brevibacillus sp. NRS-1366 TaxID=3233899 RepID=UPI003D25F6E8